MTVTCSTPGRTVQPAAAAPLGGRPRGRGRGPAGGGHQREHRQPRPRPAPVAARPSPHALPPWSADATSRRGRRAGLHCAAMGRVLAVANQKGGVAKTTTVHSLAVAPGRAGRPGAPRRPRPAGLPDVLDGPRSRRCSTRRCTTCSCAATPAAKVDPAHRRRRPAAGHHRPGRVRGPPADADRPRARARPGDRTARGRCTTPSSSTARRRWVC